MQVREISCLFLADGALNRMRGACALLLCTAAILGQSGLFAANAKFNKVLQIGQAAPEWEGLKGVDGGAHSLKDYAKAPAVVCIFTCNHCPVAKAYEERLAEIVTTHKQQGVQFVLISVSHSAVDSLDKLKRRAEQRTVSIPVLQDLTQAVGKAYGATATPQVFVLDGERKIAYMGAIDDNLEVAKVTRHYLADAIDAVLAGKAPAIPETLPRGCAIDYE